MQLETQNIEALLQETQAENQITKAKLTEYEGIGLRNSEKIQQFQLTTQKIRKESQDILDLNRKSLKGIEDNIVELVQKTSFHHKMSSNTNTCIGNCPEELLFDEEMNKLEKILKTFEALNNTIIIHSNSKTSSNHENMKFLKKSNTPCSKSHKNLIDNSLIRAKTNEDIGGSSHWKDHKKMMSEIGFDTLLKMEKLNKEQVFSGNNGSFFENDGMFNEATGLKVIRERTSDRIKTNEDIQNKMTLMENSENIMRKNKKITINEQRYEENEKLLLNIENNMKIEENNEKTDYFFERKRRAYKKSNTFDIDENKNLIKTDNNIRKHTDYLDNMHIETNIIHLKTRSRTKSFDFDDKIQEFENTKGILSEKEGNMINEMKEKINCFLQNLMKKQKNSQHFLKSLKNYKGVLSKLLETYERLFQEKVLRNLEISSNFAQISEKFQKSVKEKLKFEQNLSDILNIFEGKDRFVKEEGARNDEKLLKRIRKIIEEFIFNEQQLKSQNFEIIDITKEKNELEKENIRIKEENQSLLKSFLDINKSQ